MPIFQSLANIQEKMVANENTSHLLLRHFHCSIRWVKSIFWRF